MNPLKSLEPEERARYDYLQELFKHEFEESYFAFRFGGRLVQELLALLSLTSFLFEEYGFPDPEYLPLLHTALTHAALQYLAVFHYAP